MARKAAKVSAAQASPQADRAGSREHLLERLAQFVETVAITRSRSVQRHADDVGDLLKCEIAPDFQRHDFAVNWRQIFHGIGEKLLRFTILDLGCKPLLAVVVQLALLARIGTAGEINRASADRCEDKRERR